MNITTCPACKTAYTTQAQCPRCGHKITAPAKPKAKNAIKLAYPTNKHGVLIYYVKVYGKPATKTKKLNRGKYDRYYYDGQWWSVLELWFYVKWQQTGYIMPESEYKFHPSRRWKFDFAFKDSMIAVEMEGGSHSGGRHTRGQGFKNDIEKYNEATALGWQVYRFADMKQQHIDFMKARLDSAMAKDKAA